MTGTGTTELSNFTHRSFMPTASSGSVSSPALLLNRTVTHCPGLSIAWFSLSASIRVECSHCVPTGQGTVN
jgi:hypothetical protein